MQAHHDEYVFGWDPTPGIVSVWANRQGRVLYWRRVRDEEGNERVLCVRDRFRPWILATSLDDVSHLGSDLVEEGRGGTSRTVWYRELQGEEGSYRFLLSAFDGRTLEQAILEGASLRLQRAVKTVQELPDAYYRVGPVEQYLIGSGRVYFRGLHYDDLHRLQFDLETTALDPHRGRIFLIAVRDNRGLAEVLEAPHPEDEKRLLQTFCQLVRERDPDILENHNLFGFDLPFLEHRALIHDISLDIGRTGFDGAPMLLERYEETLAIGPEARKRTRYSVGGRELIDTLDAVRRHDFVVRALPSYGLKDVARYFGLASQERVYIEGSEIFARYQREPERVRRYALDDVSEVDGLSKRLQGAPFALAGMAPRRYERLASAGPAMGILEPMLVRAYLRRETALPGSGQRVLSGDLHEGGAVRLFASGVARNVVKADVASLYPSLMRTFQIGPSCDRLGVLLSILDRLTDLRLEQKAAAREAVPDSIEANHYEATQAAMKILINSAYGYMGAGSMALFADSQAASEVTRRGRAILAQVLQALEKRGMVLIEADTDGVYFAVPDHWNAEQEQRLVAEIGAELPAGIRLEYEGRYQAMLSHEVKNYALLTYSGELIVRGVALRSSRVEPFGERFLLQALRCTLLGDISGVRNAYLETVDALRMKRLPAIDVATRVRLSKTPEEYLAQRKKHLEPAYEALLQAGRRKWFPGERVRFYRARNRQYVWIPEETAETATHNDWEQPPGNANELRDRRDYDTEHYIQVLKNSYAKRLQKAFTPEDYHALFSNEQPGLFDGIFERPLECIQPILKREETI
ncbi:DNA polymerase elongation subunit (family B) [Thermosporothrix hazakensis]|uniref:DNA-directed DNA polymerase n=2 Tax=Thermosporothrix TaxID=768650 RepID=A0A326UDC1_THEHA|nr:DNA polymerase domain-containing protein [Thermosporothrix hazakensis]PZW36488.1 DNA polymerase elongation subunit (family B) [Thermosporothrix hazakensis]BBH88957.1 DNA polymerase [Thermosporothrix sp. COM3]GCE47142.1 DNA polymerase [Thermosporothrix hazakensis]